jgi:hypothetical protein
MFTVLQLAMPRRNKKSRNAKGQRLSGYDKFLSPEYKSSQEEKELEVDAMLYLEFRELEEAGPGNRQHEVIKGEEHLETGEEEEDLNIFDLEGDEDVEPDPNEEDVDDFYKGVDDNLRSVDDCLTWSKMASTAKLPGRAAYTGNSERTQRREKHLQSELQEAARNTNKCMYSCA